MLYDGVLNYDYNTIVAETECYADAARKIVTLNADEAIGMVDSDNVIIIFDVTDNRPIVVTERCSLEDITEERVNERINKFNEKSKNYIASVTRSGEWLDIIVTRSSVYKVIEETM